MKRFVYLLAFLIAAGNIVFAEESLINDQANLLYAENRIEEAFNLLLTIPPETRTPMNWLLLGNILQDKGRDDDADFMFSQAAVDDTKFYKAMYNLGNLYLEQDKPNLAIEQYKKVLKLKPEFSYAYYNMGCAYLKLGKLKDARRNFLYAIDYNPTVADFHYNLAYTYKKLNKPKDAQIYLDYYNKIIQNGN
ncbi:TPA: tetratricopeptide repeat protein [Candidatus Scatousia excrementigallinarum]|uniref:Tetratricopeptide repeat protein n=1 Tax=Candidatus Scatousia excrementigallinarum TaxID=2840935 RepID=A0A9D1JM81_9BACT|nr:tetratricopeptide repeat protein [Candidatus Scatousia excrementigallinarum]